MPSTRMTRLTVSQPYFSFDYLSLLVWDDVYGFNFSCIKKVALSEPLVDVVDQEQVITDSAPILEVDIMTVTKEQLSFDSNFTLHVKHNDFCHALVAYFDMAFTKGHKIIQFSTGPHAKYTHWKQTVFYLLEDLAVNENDEIEGNIKCKPNAINNRDLDIELTLEHNGRQQSQQYMMR